MPLLLPLLLLSVPVPGGGSIHTPHTQHRGKLNAMLPGDDFGPNINFIGLKTQDWIKNSLGWMMDLPPNLVPADLVNAMKLTRSTRLTQPPGVARPVGICAAPPLGICAAPPPGWTAPNTTATNAAPTASDSGGSCSLINGTCSSPPAQGVPVSSPSTSTSG
jgi:hypothetical protein